MVGRFFSLRFFFLSAVLFALALGGSWGCQQQPTKKQYLVGIINPNAGTQDISAGFIGELANSGFVEGENTTFLEHESNFEIDEVIRDLISRKADLIFTVTTPATLKTKEATRGKNIPVIFAMQDPVDSGIIPSLARPEKNITGVQIRGSVPKTVEWMMAVKPAMKHLFVPVKFDTKAADQSMEDLRNSATQMGIRLSHVEVNDQTELDAALAAIPDDADAIFILHSIFIQSNTEKLVQAAIEKKLLIGSAAAQSDKGVTISYGMIAEKTGRQAGRMAGLILQGRKAVDIPAEIADFFVGINLQTAAASGIHIPLDVLQQADIIVR